MSLNDYNALLDRRAQQPALYFLPVAEYIVVAPFQLPKL